MNIRVQRGLEGGEVWEVTGGSNVSGGKIRANCLVASES